MMRGTHRWMALQRARVGMGCRHFPGNALFGDIALVAYMEILPGKAKCSLKVIVQTVPHQEQFLPSARSTTFSVNFLSTTI